MKRRGFLQAFCASVLTPITGAMGSVLPKPKPLPLQSPTNWSYATPKPYLDFAYSRPTRTNVGAICFSQELKTTHVFDGNKWILISTK